MKHHFGIYCIIVVIILASTATAKEFRVAIKTDGFQRLTHTSAVISSEDGPIFLVDYNSDFQSSLPVTLTPCGEGILVDNGQEKLLMGERLWIYPQHLGRLTIESITRGDAWAFHPAYRGFLEVQLAENHELLIINTVTVEQYLYGVVPSEMSVSWPLEALKAQAVASRTYVVRAILDAQTTGRPYDLDDSVYAQVYNNRKEDPRAKQAVDATAGMVMLDQDGQLIHAYFHSTSWGLTAASHEVWGGSSRTSFPGSPISYLMSRSVLSTDLAIDWSDEAQALSFFKDWSVTGFEQQSPWFRWRIRLTRERLEKIINAHLAERYQAQPEFVLTRIASGEFVPQPIPPAGIGQLLDIRVIKRGSGGNIMILEIEGTTGTYQISKELNIRYLLRPTNQFTGGDDVIIERIDGQIRNYAVLPSASFACEIIREDGVITEVVIYGGGNGHGVGMSQWGAKGMAEAGYTCEEILKAFYSDVRFVDVYTHFNWPK